jgi:uncharacterized protein (DUF1499 family)
MLRHVQKPSLLARLAAGLGCGGAGAFALGPLAVQLSLLSPFIGFRVFALGLLLGLSALLLGLAALWTTRPASGRGGRGAALLGAGLGAVIVGIAGFAIAPAAGLPTINDITTDLADPPVFVNAGRLPENRGRDLAHPGGDFASQQRAGYPDLEPIRLAQPPAEAFARALAAAEGLGWEVTYREAGSGSFEAVEVSRIFHFVDDVAVRVRPAPGGSVVDVRSKSRDGKGDLGANAARIRALRDALRD